MSKSVNAKVAVAGAAEFVAGEPSGVCVVFAALHVGA